MIHEWIVKEIAISLFKHNIRNSQSNLKWENLSERSQEIYLSDVRLVLEKLEDIQRYS